MVNYLIVRQSSVALLSQIDFGPILALFGEKGPLDQKEVFLQ